MSSIAPATDERDRGPTQGRRWAPWAQIVVSLLLVWHVAAVLMGPLSFPPTMISNRVHPIFRPYLGATFLDHGYKFFAPDPGPSHLVRYELEFADGSNRGGVFPNLDDQWPRLFYHRHFMLSEFINTISGPDPNWTPQTDLTPPPDWTRLPLSEAQRQFARSYGEHILHKYDARRVTLWLREHLMPSPDEFAKGKLLDDPSLYRERKLGSFVDVP
jgi:hypothetical protein